MIDTQYLKCEGLSQLTTVVTVWHKRAPTGTQRAVAQLHDFTCHMATAYTLANVATVAERH